MNVVTYNVTVCAGSRTQAKAAGSNGTAAAPSRGVLILPGLANNSADYAGLSQHLHDKGMSTRVVEVSISSGEAAGRSFSAGTRWSRVVVSNCHSKQHPLTTLGGAETCSHAQYDVKCLKCFAQHQIHPSGSKPPSLVGPLLESVQIGPDLAHQPQLLCSVWQGRPCQECTSADKRMLA
jgi:hypothetical protein